ncbi:purine nucleosidase [Ketogulonicigenium robustum]|uniref:Purine nucleosidase n=1 Tax=Ketogulonicigenium robustum TaxID=92947 RepID=A0A1W6P005_9RHOB|nr:nucleoside hydrolase [Ketogulonicigenium robustum]ARO14660.1 purine nucleosidase [Ketogulonicigenium robustum]
MKHLWIDTDMGFDDLAAIGFCLAEGAQVAALSIVAGNVELPQGVENACASADVYGWTMPIHAGASAPIAGPLHTASYVLGDDGMPTAGRRLPTPQPHTVGPDAIAALADWILAGGRDVLALGPLTNIAHLVQRFPDAARLAKVVWMGGAFARGNHTAVSEFNAAVDPEAINIVLRGGVDLVMVGLECCRDVMVTLDDLPPLRAIAGEPAQLLADVYEGYIRIAANGTRPMALYDPVAAAVIIDEALAELQPVHMLAEEDGTLTRGMTVIEWRTHKAAPNMRVALNPNATEIRRRFHAALAAMAQGAA